MTGITHEQAGRYMRADLDGLLTAAQSRDLTAHLDECEACRLESESFSLLTARLKTDFQARWDTQHGPSTNVMANVQSQTRRIIMKKRIDFAFNILGGAAALLVLFFVVTSIISQFQKKSTAANGTQATNGTATVFEQLSSIATDKFNGEWIAFISGEYVSAGNEKLDVYMIHPDGTGLINLTNSPAYYYYLQWSPNGANFAFLRTSNTTEIMGANQNGTYLITATNFDSSNIHGPLYSWSPNSEQIAFIDNRSGNYDIYTLYADGRNDTQLKQLTNDPGQDGGFVWSPDGGQIAFQRLDSENLSIYVMNEDGSDQREVARGSGKVQLRWSLDGKSIYASSTENSWLECEACVAKPAVYQIDLDGQSVHQLYAEQDASKVSAWYLYDTPQNTLYFMRIDPPAFVEFWGSWMQAEGNSIHEIGSMDPQQTCKSTTGNSLNEHISPNERFSVISNYCAGGFDLYLADRETSDPEKKLVHLIKLPAETFGQGGNNDSLPILWSPDGRWLIYDNGQAAMYLLNVERAMQDPTIEPSLLFQSGIYSAFEAAWQPALANNIVDQKPTQPDGLIAYVNDTNGNAEIYTMRADGSNPTNLTNHSSHDVNPIWSPDGEHILFESNPTDFSQIYIMNADGSNLTQLTNEKAEHAIGTQYRNTPEPWSPDGKKIIYSQRVPGEDQWMLYVMDADGNNKIALTREPGVYNFLGWSPDGNKIVYEIANFGDHGQPRIIFANIDGTGTIDGIAGIDFGTPYQILWEKSDQLMMLGNNFNVEPTTWHLSRMLVTTDTTVYNGFGPIIVTSNSPIVAIFDKTYVVEDQNSLTRFVYDGAPIPLSPWSFSELCNSTDPLVQETFHIPSPDKQQDFISLLCPEGNNYFFLMNTDGTEIHQLGEPLAKPLHVNAHEWSPDGNYVIVTIFNNEGTELYRFDIQEMLNNPATKPVQLTTDGAMKYGAIWQPIINNDIVEEKPTPEPVQTSSPNDLVAFMAETNLATNNSMDIYTMRMDGSAVTNLTHDPEKDFNANDYNPTWSPDKKKIAFISDRGGNSTGNTDIFVMNPDGSNQTQLTNNPGLDDFLAWSPDGKHIAYYSSPLDEFYATGQLIIMNSDGSNKTVITPEPGYYYFQGWSPDGQKIVYGKPGLVGESFKDIGIHLVNIDGKNQHEWIVANFDQLHWEDSEHFLGVVQIGTETQPQWTLYSFSTDGSQREIATHNAPIAAIFENAYVIDGQDGSTWFTHAGNPIPAIPWNPTEECQATGDSFISTSHVIAPDKKQAFVMIHCETSTRFYLENEDGSKIEPLSGSIDSSLGSFPQWSSDGKYVSIIHLNYKEPFADTAVYFFDLEKMRNDPSTQPIQVTLNMTVDGYMVFGFPPGDNDKLQQPTPKPLTFSLTAQQAKLLANFTVLEPSYLPVGYILEGMDYDPYTQKIAMKYISQQSEGALFIYQRRGDFVHDPAVQAYVTPVSIGDMEAEYIRGAWIYDTPETTIPRWDPSATFYSLTWQKGEIVFSIDFLGGETVTPLQLSEFVAIVESLK